MKAYVPVLICLLCTAAYLIAAADVPKKRARSEDPEAAVLLPFSKEELQNASPFDPAIRKRTFYAVARAMYIKRLNPDIAMPAVVVNKRIAVDQIPAYIGFELESNEINYFGYLKNTILLSEDAKIHNLAHEMTHYFQFHYQLKGKMQNLLRDPEPEAVRIQRLFRADTAPPPAGVPEGFVLTTQAQSAQR
ncbi:MAG: hypothetical protein JSW39_14690 [Desulfobacterales bacterium]|nr:MAG: hypothetical protein JSW39_14690 [Desulfobacterales bacterium]